MNGHEIPLFEYGYILLAKFADEMRFVNMNEVIQEKTISWKQRGIILFNQANDLADKYVHHPKILIRVLTLSVILMGTIFIMKSFGVEITEVSIAFVGIILTALYVTSHKSKG